MLALQFCCSHVLPQDPQLNDLHNVHDCLFQQQGQVSLLTNFHD